ncbi:MAG: oligosaccharide flippase family protein [Bacteroidetes bacterium]|nr:oligosaccharide flippase family protein [Bacteroidota bacterium]
MKSNFLVYSAGTIINKGLLYIGSFVFAYFLSTEEYGKYAVFAAIIPFISVISSLNLPSSIRQYEYKYSRNTKIYLTNILILTFFVQLLAILIYLNISDPLILSLNLDKQFKPLILVIIITSPIIMIGEQYYLGKNDSKQYVFLGLIKVITEVFLGFVLIKLFIENSWYRSLGTTLAYVSVFVVVIYKLRKYFLYQIKLNKHYIKYALAFSIPIILHQISNNVLAISDRIVISQIIGFEENGVYSFVYSLSSINFLLILAANQAAVKKYYSHLKNERFSQINNKFRIINEFTILITLLSATLLVLTFYFISPEDYKKGIDIILPIMSSSLGILCYLYYVNFNFYKNRTSLISIGTVFSAFINVFINYLYLEDFGLITAALSTWISYFFMALYNYCVVKIKSKKATTLSLKPLILCIIISAIHIWSNLVVPPSENILDFVFIQTLLLAMTAITLKKWKKLRTLF